MAYSTGAQDKKTISAYSLLDRPDLLRAAIDTNNEEGLIDFLVAGKKTKKVRHPVFHNWTEDALHILMDTTGATITGSGTPTLSGVTLTAATSGYARKGLKVLMPNKKVGQITNITTAGGQDTLTIKSVDGTNLTLTAGQKLSPLNILVGERSTAPASLKHGWTKYFNLIEQHREAYDISDVQLGSQIEIEYNGQPYVFDRDRANTEMRFKAGINATFMAGVISATKFEDASPSLTDPGNGGAEQAGRGLNQYIETYGVNDTVDVAGTVDLDDMESFFKLLDAARAPKEFIVYGANAVQMKFSSFLKNLNDSGAKSGRLSLDGQELNWNVTNWTFGHYSLQFARMGILDNPVLFSQTDIVKSAYFVPQGKVPVKMGGAEDRIQIRYMEANKTPFGTDMWEVWESGALARPYPQGDERVRRVNFFTSQSIEVLGANNFGKLVVL